MQSIKHGKSHYYTLCLLTFTVTSTLCRVMWAAASSSGMHSTRSRLMAAIHLAAAVRGDCWTSLGTGVSFFNVLT